MTGKYIEIETDLDLIMTELGLSPFEGQLSYKWLKELILHAVQKPDSWQHDYLETIGRRENISRERVRQMLYKAAWDNWSRNSKKIFEAHFGSHVQIKFEYVKPNHIEFITLISGELRKKYSFTNVIETDKYKPLK